MVVLDKISLQYGNRILFDEISAAINYKDRIGLVGANGSGKSTFLKMLCGLVEYDAGSIKSPNYISYGYLPQDGLVAAGKTLYEEIESSADKIIELRKKISDSENLLHQLSEDIERSKELITQIANWEDELSHLNADTLKSRIESILHGLGFAQTDMNRKTEEFSGGWQMRIALAKLLFREPSILLLDEPTNHLDIESQDWLENWLNRYSGSLILVSHDRAFLDSITKKIFALEHNKLDIYNGNYSYYEKTSKERREVLKRSAESQEREIKKTEAFIEKFRSKATKAAQVQSRIKALDKVERINYIEEDNSKIAFRFPPATPSGQVVLTLKNIYKNYSDLNVLKNISLKIEKGERIAVVGVNGAGKSTLIRLLANIEPPTEGERIEGLNVSVSYFAQHQAKELDPNLDVFTTVNNIATGLGTSHLRSLLGSFLFRGEDVFKPVSVLSGGEKNRLALAKMLLHSFNFLILDEPTNHLDMRSKEVLSQALKNYAGTFVIVSHDRDFLDPLITRVIEVKNKSIRSFVGNVTDYLNATAEERRLEREAFNEKLKMQKSNPGVISNTDPKARRRANAEKAKLLAPIKKEIATIEQNIEKYELEQKKIEEAMLAPDFYTRDQTTKDDLIYYDNLKKQIATAYENWEIASEKLQKIEIENQ